MDTPTKGALPTTAGAIAIGNLQAQIDGHAREAAVGRLTVRGRAALIELITLRGHLLGRIMDYERAEAMAEQLAHDAPFEGDALLVRARARATFHRFTDGLVDIDEAESLGAHPERVAAERAAIFQATGRFDEALSIYEAAVERRADFNSLGDLATLHAERGDIAAAETCFSESRARYPGVSPIPLAQLDFKRAQMWMTQGDPPRARSWLEDAVRRLPGYAPAAGHLAEVEAALGQTDAAIGRLRPLAFSSDDPDYAAQLARILGEVGRLEDAAQWRALAAARYDELATRHLEAFADHAAEFWLEAGADAARALWFAEKNLNVRPTRRARELVARAAEDTAHVDSRTSNGVGTKHNRR